MPDLDYYYHSSAKRRMHYRLSCFLLHNLVLHEELTWREADVVHTELARILKLDSWAHGRVDYDAERSFGRRLSGMIECEDCGLMYGHKTWHSGTPNRADVWECPTNHKKRGSCKPGHLYEAVLKEKLLEAMLEMSRRTPQVWALLMGALTTVRPQTKSTHLNKIVERIYASELDCHIFLPDILDIVEGGCMLNDKRLGFVLISSEAVTLTLPALWTPKRQNASLS